jgi:hypothetical protein
LVGIATAVFGQSMLWFNVISHAIAGGSMAIAWNSAADRAQREALGLKDGS